MSAPAVGVDARSVMLVHRSMAGPIVLIVVQGIVVRRQSWGGVGVWVCGCVGVGVWVVRRCVVRVPGVGVLVAVGVPTFVARGPGARRPGGRGADPVEAQDQAHAEDDPAGDE